MLAGGYNEELYKRLNIVEISEMVSRERLGWFGHVMRSGEDEWISRCRNFECDVVRGRGWSKKTWEECNKKDLRDRGLKKEWALDRSNGRDSFWENVLPAFAWTKGRKSFKKKILNFNIDIH